jgi:hypothetical protein
MHEITFVGAIGDKKADLFEAAAKALSKRKVTCILSTRNDVPETEIVACWGWRMGRRLKKHGKRVIVFENGYIGDRSQWISIGVDGLNGRAQFGLPKIIKPERFTDNFEMKPWKAKGKYILIMGQIPGDMSLQGIDLTKFYEDSARVAGHHYQLPVYFRPHPIGEISRGNFTPDIPKLACDLKTALDGAHLVITYNSNSAVDAVLAGVPTVTYDLGSMAYPVTSHNVRERITPDRLDWAARVASCQYNMDEIAAGKFWTNIKKVL